MLSLRKPSPTTVESFLGHQAKLEFTYSAVGATARRPPGGYTVDHTRIEIGQGEADFVAAKEALRRWEHFRVGWVEACPPETPIRTGSVVAVVARLFGLWCINACRIVYVVDDEEATIKHGFAYGTLPDHVESGEERFLIEWDRANDHVWYDILAFSRPHQIQARLGYPFVRQVQKRFMRDSAASMLRAVGHVR
jgi:uncharacterized protein (UPF0548 family)